MVRGYQRRVIMLKGERNAYFDTAYFILRADAEKERRISEDEMLCEAQRIIAESGFPRKKRAENISFGAIALFLGGICGGIVLCALAFTIF